MSDLISRQAALDAIQQRADRIDSVYSAFWEGLIIAQDVVKNIPSAESELEEFEWCHDCKEYDQEKHCCHRWTKVIRKTVEDMKNRWQWIPVTEALPQNYQQTICIDSRGKMMIGTYGEYGWTFPCYMNEPVAWMPLPESYKGD